MKCVKHVEGNIHPPRKYHGALQRSKIITVCFSGRITPKPEARIIPVKTVTRAPCWVNAGMLGWYTDYLEAHGT